MQGRIDHPRRPKMISRVVPFTGLAGDAQFQIVMGFKGHKETQARAAGWVAVQIRCHAVGPDPHVAAQIKIACRSGSSGSV